MKVIYDLWSGFTWRTDAYEYEPTDEKHALEQLIGTTRFREILESGAGLDAWVESWDLSPFLQRREEALLY